MHPGEILNEEFIKPFGLNASKLAKLLDVPTPRINDILLEKRGITPDTALRLAHYFKTTPEFWMNMQMFYDLRKAEMILASKIKNLPVIKLADAQIEGSV